MPLLDRLKVNGSSQWAPPCDDNGNALADQWMSLSNAIGVDVEHTGSLDSFNTGAAVAAVSPSSSIDDFLWERVTNIIPPDLLDALVRSYFTISHLRESVTFASVLIPPLSVAHSSRSDLYAVVRVA
jgi:hypothetical protein